MAEMTWRNAAPRFSQALRFQTMLDEIGMQHEPSMGGVAFREHSERGELSGRLDPVLRRNRERRRTELLGLRLTLQSPLVTGGRLVLAERRLSSWFTRWLNRYGGLQPLAPPPALAHLDAWSHEPPWAQRLLADPDLAAQIGALLAADDAPPHAALHWNPDQLTFIAQDSQADVLHRFPEWRLRLLALAAVARALPPPSTAHRPRWIETRPVLVLIVIVLAVLLAGLLFTAIAIAISFLLV